MNPGPATSIFSKYVPSSETKETIVCAIFLGGRRNVLAFTIAALTEKSPFALSAGTSILKSALSASGKSPDLIASFIAFFISELICSCAFSVVSFIVIYPFPSRQAFGSLSSSLILNSISPSGCISISVQYLKSSVPPLFFIFELIFSALTPSEKEP